MEQYSKKRIQQFPLLSFASQFVADKERYIQHVYIKPQCDVYPRILLFTLYIFVLAFSMEEGGFFHHLEELSAMFGGGNISPPGSYRSSHHHDIDSHSMSIVSYPPDSPPPPQDSAVVNVDPDTSSSSVMHPGGPNQLNLFLVNQTYNQHFFNFPERLSLSGLPGAGNASPREIAEPAALPETEPPVGSPVPETEQAVGSTAGWAPKPKPRRNRMGLYLGLLFMGLIVAGLVGFFIFKTCR